MPGVSKSSKDMEMPLSNQEKNQGNIETFLFATPCFFRVCFTLVNQRETIPCPRAHIKPLPSPAVFMKPYFEGWGGLLTEMCRSQSWAQKGVGFYPRCPQTCSHGRCTPERCCDPAPSLSTVHTALLSKDVSKRGAQNGSSFCPEQQHSQQLIWGRCPKICPGNLECLEYLFVWICLNWYKLKAIIQPLFYQKGTCTWASLGLLFLFLCHDPPWYSCFMQQK